MKSSILNKVKYMIAQMLTEEYDAHSDLIDKISKRKPADIDKILENLSAISNARKELLEKIMSELKEMGK